MKNLENNKKFNSLIEKFKTRKANNQIDTDIENNTYELLEKITIINKSKENSLFNFEFNTFNSITELLDTFFNISNSTANNIDLKNPEKIPIKKDKKKNNSLLTNLILGSTATLIAAKYLKLLPDFKTISEKFSINYETVNNITNISKNSNENSEISDLLIDNEKLENDNSESNTNFNKTNSEIKAKDLKKATTINENKELDDLDKKEQEFNNFTKFVGNNINKDYPVISLFLGSKNLIINLVSDKITKSVKKFWNNISEYISGLFDWMSIKNIVNPTFGLTPTFVKFINKLFKRNTEISNLTVKDSLNKSLNKNLLSLTSVIFSGLTVVNPSFKDAETFSVFKTEVLNKLIKAIKDKDAEFENEAINAQNMAAEIGVDGEPIDTTGASYNGGAGIQDWVNYHGYDKLMIKAWSDVGIPSKYFALLKAQVKQESGYNMSAGSSAGAHGLTQFIQSTARMFGIADVWANPQKTESHAYRMFVAQGRFMKELLNKSGGHINAALVGYNAGPGRINNYLRNGSAPTESKTYIQRINAIVGQMGFITDGPTLLVLHSSRAAAAGVKEANAQWWAQYRGKNQAKGLGSGGESTTVKSSEKIKSPSTVATTIETKISDTYKKKVIVKNNKLNNKIKNKYEDNKIYQEAPKVSAKEFYKKLDSIPVIAESMGDNELVIQDTLNKLNKENIKNNIINENIVEPKEKVQNTQSFEKYSERNSEEPGMDIFDILINSDIKGNMAAI